VTKFALADEPLLVKLRIFNYFVSLMALSLTIWMSTGERILRPLCKLKVFEVRKESCYRNGAIEIRDRASIGLLVAITIIFLVLLHSRKIKAQISKESGLNSVADKIAFVVIVTAISMRSYYPSFEDWSVTEFSGFGHDVAFVAVFCAFLAQFFLVNFKTPNQAIPTLFQKLKILNTFSIFIFCGFYLPSILQLPSGLSSRNNAIYVLNEILAPVAGTLPLSSSIPQYTSLLGFPIVPVVGIFGENSVFLVATTWLSLMTLGILFALTIIWRRIFPQVPRPIALLAISALLLAASADVPGALNLASLPSWTVRFFLPSLLSLLLHETISSTWKQTKNFKFFLLGALSSLSLINNFEFGSSVVLSVCLTLLFLNIAKQINFLQLLIFTMSLLVTFTAISQIYLFENEKLRLDYLTLFSREFGIKGFLSWPMPIFGPYLVTFAIAGVSIIYSFICLNDLRDENQKDKQLLIPVIGISFFGGFWTITSTFYYAGRSVDGSLRVTFIPVLIAILGTYKLLTVDLKSLVDIASRRFALIPLLTIVFIPFALLIKAPNPWINWSRLAQKDNTASWSYYSTQASPFVNSYRDLKSRSESQIGIMAFDGNAISIITGAKNLLVVNSLADFEISDLIRNEACKKLQNDEIRLVLVEGSYEVGNRYPCPGMSDPIVQSDNGGTLFRFEPTNP
jgi:hypothetical protein